MINNCNTYNAADGACTSCEPGYVLDNTAANCVAIDNNLLEGCNKYNANLAADD